MPSVSQCLLYEGEDGGRGEGASDHIPYISSWHLSFEKLMIFTQSINRASSLWMSSFCVLIKLSDHHLHFSQPFTIIDNIYIIPIYNISRIHKAYQIKCSIFSFTQCLPGEFICKVVGQRAKVLAFKSTVECEPQLV